MGAVKANRACVIARAILQSQASERLLIGLEPAEKAIEHALAAGDTTTAAQVVARHRCEVMNLEEWHRLENWLHLFPREVISQQPELLLAEAWFLLNRQQMTDLSIALDRAEALLAQPSLEPSGYRTGNWSFGKLQRKAGYPVWEGPS